MEDKEFKRTLVMDFWEYVSLCTAIKWFIEFAPDEKVSHKIREQNMVLIHRLCNMGEE